MIRHTILFNVKPDVTTQEIEEALTAMQDLGNKLQGIFAIHTGECKFHDEKSRLFFSYKMHMGVSHTVSIDFVDENALENFFQNPVTHPAKNAIVRIALNGYNGIVGFDLENKEI
jgi:hypothetical protein